MRNTTTYVLGPAFSHSYNVAMADAVAPARVKCVDDVADAVARAGATTDARAIVPVENVLGGSVRETLRAMYAHPVRIVRAIDYRVRNVLAARGDDFAKVASHAQALTQCASYIRARGLMKKEVSATSVAMELAAADATIAAIGAPEAAAHYGLRVIATDVSDKADNVTRFVELARADASVERSRGAKTSMIVTPTEDRAGILFEILAVFQVKKINLTKIESMPTGNKMNDYLFYIDVDGSLSDVSVRQAIAFLRTMMRVDVFGSYDVIER